MKYTRIFLFMIAICTGKLAEAAEPIIIWKSQQMGYFGGQYFYISVGLPSNPTPTGTFTVKRKVIDYWSRKYKRPMPYAIFFTDAHALHSGDVYSASKGCVRVDRAFAPWLFQYAQPGRTKVIIYP